MLLAVDMRRRGATSLPVAGVVLLVILATIAWVAFAGRGVSPTITESADTLSVRAAGYHLDLAYARIDSVTLRHGLDGLERRLNALQSGNRYVGTFAMRPYGEAMLFVDARREPLVVIHAADGVTIISAADSAGAVALAGRIRDSARTHPRAVH